MSFFNKESSQTPAEENITQSENQTEPVEPTTTNDDADQPSLDDEVAIDKLAQETQSAEAEEEEEAEAEAEVKSASQTPAEEMRNVATPISDMKAKNVAQSGIPTEVRSAHLGTFKRPA